MLFQKWSNEKAIQEASEDENVYADLHPEKEYLK